MNTLFREHKTCILIKESWDQYSKSYSFGSLPSNPLGMNWCGGMYSVYAGSGGTTVQVTGVSVAQPWQVFL